MKFFGITHRRIKMSVKAALRSVLAAQYLSFLPVRSARWRMISAARGDTGCHREYEDLLDTVVWHISEELGFELLLYAVPNISK